MTFSTPKDSQEVDSRIGATGVLAVIRGPSPELTLQMVEALIASIEGKEG